MWYMIFFNDTATTEIYTLSLHDALPISRLARRSNRPRGHEPHHRRCHARDPPGDRRAGAAGEGPGRLRARSEEHTSELQSRQYLVCRLLLEKKKKTSQTDAEARHIGIGE